MLQIHHSFKRSCLVLSSSILIVFYWRKKLLFQSSLQIGFLFSSHIQHFGRGNSVHMAFKNFDMQWMLLFLYFITTISLWYAQFCPVCFICKVPRKRQVWIKSSGHIPFLKPLPLQYAFLPNTVVCLLMFGPCSSFLTCLHATGSQAK